MSPIPKCPNLPAGRRCPLCGGELYCLKPESWKLRDKPEPSKGGAA